MEAGRELVDVWARGEELRVTYLVAWCGVLASDRFKGKKQSIARTK